MPGGAHVNVQSQKSFLLVSPGYRVSVSRHSSPTGQEHPVQDCISCGHIACSYVQWCCLLGAHDPSFSPLFSLLFLKRINSPSSHFIWQSWGRYNFPLYVFVYLREGLLSVFLKFKNSVLPLLWVWNSFQISSVKRTMNYCRGYFCFGYVNIF